MHLSLRNSLRGAVCLLPCVAALALTGCGSGVGTISGKVTVNGVPLKGGSITFVSTEGKRSVTTSIGEDGRYTAERVPAGNVKVCVETEFLNPRGKTGTFTYGPPKDMQAPSNYLKSTPTDTSKLYVPISLVYANAESTPLEYKVVRGDQEYDVPLR